MVTESIMDAFPDFLNKYFLLVPLVQELFLVVRESIEKKQSKYISDIQSLLNLSDVPQASDLLFKKLKPVFQEHYKNVFAQENVEELINTSYKPRV